jgi:hypothetical protein
MGLLAARRGTFTEMHGVAILIGLTILVTATVGINVLVVQEQDTGPPDANFSYEYIESNSILLITHERGSEFPAGRLTIKGPDASVTWAEAAGTNESTMIGPGDLVQVSDSNAYGERVGKSTPISVVYTKEEEADRVLSERPLE